MFDIYLSDSPESRAFSSAASTTSSSFSSTAAAFTTTSASSSTPSPGSDQSSKSGTNSTADHHSHSGAIAGGVIGALLGLVALGALAFFARRRYQRSQQLLLPTSQDETTFSLDAQTAAEGAGRGDDLPRGDGHGSTVPMMVERPTVVPRRYYVSSSLFHTCEPRLSEEAADDVSVRLFAHGNSESL